MRFSQYMNCSKHFIWPCFFNSSFGKNRGSSCLFDHGSILKQIEIDVQVCQMELIGLQAVFQIENLLKFQNAVNNKLTKQIKNNSVLIN